MALEDIPEGARELFALSALIRACRTLVKPSSYHENDLPFRVWASARAFPSLSSGLQMSLLTEDGRRRKLSLGAFCFLHLFAQVKGDQIASAHALNKCKYFAKENYEFSLIFSWISVRRWKKGSQSSLSALMWLTNETN
jgi:hypothetical protein